MDLEDKADYLGKKFAKELKGKGFEVKRGGEFKWRDCEDCPKYIQKIMEANQSGDGKTVFKGRYAA